MAQKFTMGTYPYKVNLNLYLQSLSYGCFRQVPPPSQILWVRACPGRGTREPIGTIQLACYCPWLFTDSIWSSAPPNPLQPSGFGVNGLVCGLQQTLGQGC